MMPVAPTPKKSSSFTIESLVGKKDTPSTPSSTPTSKTSPSSSSSSPPEAASPRGSSTSPHSGASPPTALRAPRDGPFTSGLHSSFHPVTPNGAKTLFPEVPFPLESLPPHFHGHLGIPAAHTPPHLGPLGPGGLAHHHQAGLPPSLHHHPFFMGANRDSFPFYPWLLSRNGGFLHHRFAGPDAGLLLQPFRKPKRIRTAFSPSQLLRLEHAFEKNHYVVGQERKELAANLSLTETQVKVWFQNRRTKYKRLKAEEAESRGGKEAADDSDPDHVMLEDSREEEEEEEGVEEDDEIEEMMTEEIDIESRINERDTEDRSLEGSPTAVAASTSAMSQITDAPQKTSHHLNRWRVETNLL